MATAQSLVEGALRNLRVTKRGFTASAEDLNEGFEAVNQLLDSLSAGGMYVPHRTRESLAISAPQSSYTIGTGGNFNTVRPVKIEGVTLRDANNDDYVVSPYSLGEYNQVSLKNIEGLPVFYYYEATYPLGTLYFERKPAASYTTLILDTLKPLTAFATLGTTVTLPQGWERALKYLLVEELADEYGKQIPMQLMKKIEDAKDMLLTTKLATRKATLQVDAALMAGGGFNIYAGE